MIDKDTAEVEFLRFCEEWEIDADTADMNEDDKVGFEQQKSKILKAIVKGRLAVNDDGSLTYTLSRSSENIDVIIKRPGGAALMEMDKYKDRESMHKIYSVLGSMTGKPPSFFSNLDGIDLKPFTAVVALFLAS